jgi:hypothetical protein
MLTDAKVRTAKPRPKPYKLADTNRLFLLVAPGGGKLWRWNYTFDGKHRTMAFGAYPLVSLADARARRDDAYTLLCEGRDPTVAKKLRIEANLEASRQLVDVVCKVGWRLRLDFLARDRGCRCRRVISFARKARPCDNDIGRRGNRLALRRCEAHRASNRARPTGRCVV